MQVKTGLVLIRSELFSPPKSLARIQIVPVVFRANDRRAVFDVTFGRHSLNNSTPSDNYLGEKCHYTYPKLEDFQQLILICGAGCLLWKQDLARFPLIPLSTSTQELCGEGYSSSFLHLCSD